MTDHVTPTATYSLHGDGLELRFAADAHTLDITTTDLPLPGEREFKADDLTITSDGFATLVTACLLPSDRAGIGTFLTLAVSSSLPVEDSGAKGIAIITRRRDTGSGVEVLGSEVRVLEGTITG
jgi:hypothetical protein